MWSGYNNSPIVLGKINFRQYDRPTKSEFRIKNDEIVLKEDVLDDDGLELML